MFAPSLVLVAFMVLGTIVMLVRRSDRFRLRYGKLSLESEPATSSNTDSGVVTCRGVPPRFTEDSPTAATRRARCEGTASQRAARKKKPRNVSGKLSEG